MSLLADHWLNSSFHRKPFSQRADEFWNSRPTFASTKFPGSLFESFSDSSSSSSKMRVRNSGGPSFADMGFYSDFDSIFHDLASTKSSRRHFWDSEDSGSVSRRHASETKGKEFIIPIRVETASPSSKKYTPTASSDVSEKVTPAKSTPCNGKMIEIPIIREPSTQPSQKIASSVGEKTRSHVVPAGGFKVPQNFTLLTPTTEELNGRKQKKNNPEDDVICLDEEDFFPSQKSSFTSDSRDKIASVKQVQESGVTPAPMEIDGHEQDPITSPALRRKPLRHNLRFASNASHATSLQNDAAADVIRHDGDAPNAAKCCQSSFVTEVTPPPSYPVYRHLKTR
jgi:hypothetical protein